MELSTPHRPLGISIIAILAVVNGFLGLCAPLVLVAGGGVATLFTGPVGLVAVCGGLLLLVGPLLWFAVGFGAWNLRPWAWWLGLIATGITVLSVIANILSGVGIFQAVASAPLSIIIFFYLLLPNVRQAFRIGSA